MIIQTQDFRTREAPPFMAGISHCASEKPIFESITRVGRRIEKVTFPVRHFIALAINIIIDKIFHAI
jgi:hypothetical protein